MKKIFTLIIIFLLSGYSFNSLAQLNKGSWITTLDIRGSYSNYHSELIHATLCGNSSLIKLLQKNLGLGISMGISQEWQQYPTIGNPELFNKTRYKRLEAGPVLRKYFGDYRFKPYTELGLGWQFNKSSDYINDDRQYTDNYTDFYIRPTVGIGYWISDKVSLDLNLGFDYIPDYGHGDWLMNMGFSVKLGD